MSTADAKINIRIDHNTKEQAKKTLEALGLDLSSGVKLFLKSVITTQSIPFDVVTENGYTLREEQEMLNSVRELKEDLKNGKAKTYKSFEELMDSLND